MTELIPAPARLPPGLRVYAVGDVHGCLDRLIALHDAIAADLAARPASNTILIHLGDYIDRGPDSAGVIALLCRGDGPLSVSHTINLMGNHEDLMLAAITSRTEEAGALWLMNGGGETLASWGLTRSPRAAIWADAIPPDHLAFTATLRLTHTVGPYVFVHAGIRPGTPLGQQERQDLLWIREPFLSSPADHGAVIVHGHTPRPAPQVLPNRIGIDTGAVMGGRLTCLVLENDRLGFITR